MDIIIAEQSPFDLPSKHRAGAILVDGSTTLDASLDIPGDKALLQAGGDPIERLLWQEKNRLSDGQLALGEVLRLHPGQLHCDMLLWLATRESKGASSGDAAEAASEEDGSGQSADAQAADKAPDANTLAKAIGSALVFASERNVARVACGALGDGVGALDPMTRLVEVVSILHRYAQTRKVEDTPIQVEEVVVCASSPSVARELSRRMRSVVSRSLVQRPEASPEAEKAKRKPSKRKTTAGTKKVGSRSKRLSEEEVRDGMLRARDYRLSETFDVDEWLVHSKFGPGRVEEVIREGFVAVRFADGEVRKFVHGRNG